MAGFAHPRRQCSRITLHSCPPQAQCRSQGRRCRLRPPRCRETPHIWRAPPRPPPATTPDWRNRRRAGGPSILPVSTAGPGRAVSTVASPECWSVLGRAATPPDAARGKNLVLTCRGSKNASVCAPMRIGVRTKRRRAHFGWRSQSVRLLPSSDHEAGRLLVRLEHRAGHGAGLCRRFVGRLAREEVASARECSHRSSRGRECHLVPGMRCSSGAGAVPAPIPEPGTCAIILLESDEAFFRGRIASL
eukprot:COSAG01_NODE_10781_length_2081_cov_1.995964_2_plen_247_part_00